jgi:hypothetical protein
MPCVVSFLRDTRHVSSKKIEKNLLIFTPCDTLWHGHYQMGDLPHMSPNSDNAHALEPFSLHKCASKVAFVRATSSCAQYVTLQQIFFTSKFSYLLFCSPIHKTEFRTASVCEGLLIANSLNQSL